MDKLILHRRALARALLLVVLTALLTTVLLISFPVVAVGRSDSKSEALTEVTTEDLGSAFQILDHIHSLSQRDTIPSSRILEEAAHMWHRSIADRGTDSTRTSDVLIERLFSSQNDHIGSLLSKSETDARISSINSDRLLDEVTQSIKQLSDLHRIVLAARDSIRSSLLVVSSVGCRCELARCSRMAKLFESMQSEALNGPVAMVDLIQTPPLENLLGNVTIPYWILFSETGDSSTIIEGASDAVEVRASVVSWLGTPQTGVRKAE
jgi:hypothetical protein